MGAPALAELHEIFLDQAGGALELVAGKHCRCDTANAEVTKRRFLSNCFGRQAADCGLVEILEIKPPSAVCFRSLQGKRS
jgi:hypothetical protein